MKLGFDPKKILRYRGFIITLVVIGLFGYTARQISEIVAVTPDQAYIDAAKKKANVNIVKLDVKTIDSLKNLAPVDSHVDLGQVGKGDPFSP